MCCKVVVRPLDRRIAEMVLAVGMFERDGYGGWRREIEDENTSTRVSASLNEDALELSLSPAISTHEGHFHKRNAAGVMFEIAAKYAEKVGGEMQQWSNVDRCREGGVTTHVIAAYPSRPLLYENLCVGFREVFMAPDF